MKDLISFSLVPITCLFEPKSTFFNAILKVGIRRDIYFFVLQADRERNMGRLVGKIKTIFFRFLGRKDLKKYFPFVF